MTTKYTKFMLGVFILFSVLGCLGIEMAEKTPDSNGGQLPRKKVDITIDMVQQQVFFEQLQKFAEKHNFMIQIDVQPSGPQDFLIYMTREDIIISGANFFAPGEYKLAVFDADRQRPVSESVVDDLVNDLTNIVSKVPGTTFSTGK